MAEFLFWVKLLLIIVFPSSLAGNPCSCRSANYFCFIWHFIGLSIHGAAPETPWQLPSFIITQNIDCQLSPVTVSPAEDLVLGGSSRNTFFEALHASALPLCMIHLK